MLTPNDILEKKFSTKLRGYNEDQVDDFLDTIKFEFENLLMENDKYKSESNALKEEIESKNEEMESDNYLDKAEKANSMIEKAKNASEKYINDAQLTAERIIAAATNKAKQIEQETKENGVVSTPSVANTTSSFDQSEKEKRFALYLDELKSKAELLYKKSEDTAALIIEEAEQEAAKIKKSANDLLLNAKAKFDQEYKSKLDKIDEDQKVIASKKADAEKTAQEIIDNANAKADNIKRIMNIQISNSKQRLEDMEKNILEYKEKFDGFVNGYSGFFKNVSNDLINNDEDTVVVEAKEFTQIVQEVPVSKSEDKPVETVVEEKPAKKQPLKSSFEDFSKLEDSLKNFEDLVKNEQSFEVKSINPIVDLTDIVEDDTDDIISDFSNDDIDDNEAISEAEKEKLRDMLDDIL